MSGNDNKKINIEADMKTILENFFDYAYDNGIEIYNEFSLQHELGIYLRKILSGKYKIQFERNVSYFNINKNRIIKKEIDIVIIVQNKKYAIELKFPRNGQYPEQMYSFIKDIKFSEQLKENKFTKVFSFVLVDDKNFYEYNSSKKEKGIYSFFRNSKFNIKINKRITKPTGKTKESIILNKKYFTRWKNCKLFNNDKICKYYIIEN
jgi:hypothetical protein